MGTGSSLPERIVPNQDLADGLGIPDNWIVDKTGICARRVARPDEATSDFAIRASRRALCNAGIRSEDLDLIIVGTSTPDHPQPATACLVQNTLGASRAAAFDVNAVCSSFVYALETARSLLSADLDTTYALVIGADVYSRQLDYRDRRTCVLFGDGAGAVVLGPSDKAGYGVIASKLISDGSLYELVMVPGGGTRIPLTTETLASGAGYFKMRGRDVREYVERVFPELLHSLVEKAGYTLSDLELVIPHQANGVMLRDCARKLGLPDEKLYCTYRNYGNTGAASIPITLDDAVLKQQLPPGALIALVGFGGGMTAGGLLLRWSGNVKECGDLSYVI
jgi:3-oxoacyl-[acyl-carrier-protein] synthase-3